MTEKITAADAIRLLDTGKAVAVDVREPDEYAVGHIPGAKLLPLGQVIDRAAEVLMEAAPREGSHRGKGRHHGGCRPVSVPGGGHPAGVRHDRFDGEPFDVSESYMRLMLEG